MQVPDGPQPIKLDLGSARDAQQRGPPIKSENADVVARDIVEAVAVQDVLDESRALALPNPLGPPDAPDRSPVGKRLPAPKIPSLGLALEALDAQTIGGFQFPELLWRDMDVGGGVPGEVARPALGPAGLLDHVLDRLSGRARERPGRSAQAPHGCHAARRPAGAPNADH
jgi:hypothetical protein